MSAEKLQLIAELLESEDYPTAYAEIGKFARASRYTSKSVYQQARKRQKQIFGDKPLDQQAA